MMPVIRSFKEIQAKYGLCRQDQRALKSFGGAIQKLILAHAPTDQEKKGSALFFKVMTEVIEAFKNAEWLPIQGMTWDAAMRALSNADIYFDQHLIGAYGAVTVEASIFKEAIFVRLDSDVIDVMEKTSGMKNPFIQWPDTRIDKEAAEKMLLERVVGLCDNPRLIREFGEKTYAYCKSMHDEKPVCERFLRLIEGMD
jgi:hypothetical protein